MTTPQRLEHRYQPVGAPLELFRSRAPEVLLSGAAGTGKTRGALEKVHAMCLLNPGMRALVCRKTATSLTSTTLVTWREHVAKEALASGEVKWYGGSQQQAASYEYANGSSVTVGGLDKATRIMSSEYDACYVGEATELLEEDWEAITTRLRNGKVSFQQLLADCNPGPPHHWLKQRCDRGATQMIYCRHEDNPRLFDPAAGEWTAEGKLYLARLDALTGVRRERLRYGRWAAADGLVYDGFDPALHLSTRFGKDSLPPRDWPRYLAIDFGFRNPFVCQWWVEDPDGRLYMYREVYMTGRLVEDHAKQIARLQRTRHGAEPAPRAVICDHDAEDRATLERHLGYSTVAAHKDVKPGIEAVQARLRPGADGKPRLFICRDALVERDPALEDAKKPASTAEEIVEYVWDPSQAPTLQGQPKEAPLKRGDHGCLVAGTMVTTAAGSRPIEYVHAGDVVATREGWRTVTASGMTDGAARVFQVALSSGETLTGTGNHPVWVTGAGWKRLDALRYGDRLAGCPERTPPPPTSSPSAASASAVTPTRPTGRTARTTRPGRPTRRAASAGFTRKSGNRPTVPYRTAARSTTRTSTRSTTSCPTSSASPSPGTRTPTANAGASVRAPRNGASTLRASARLPLAGTRPQKEARGIPRTPGAWASATASRARRRASSAGSLTRRPRSTAATGSARMPASRHGAGPAAWTTRSAPARTAGSRSGSTGTARRGRAAVRVLSVCALPARVPVFNLTVDGTPEYFASGVLVHNCDAMRYLVAHVDITGTPRLRSFSMR